MCCVNRRECRTIRAHELNTYRITIIAGVMNALPFSTRIMNVEHYNQDSIQCLISRDM